MPTLNSLIVNYFIPILPGKWRLPFIYWKDCSIGAVEQELIHLQKISTSFRVAVDIGANQGLYSYKMSRHFLEVYAFEINPALTLNLRRYAAENIRIFDWGLSSREGEATLYTPVLENGFALTGWASLSRADTLQEIQNLNGKAHLIEMPVRIGMLDALKLQHVDLVKIDVEGHEVEVLKGALETLRCNRPHLLIETKSRLPEVDSLLSSLRYHRFPLEQVIRRPASTDLYLYIPHSDA